MLILNAGAEQAIVFPNLRANPHDFKLYHTLPEDTDKHEELRLLRGDGPKVGKFLRGDSPELKELLAISHIYSKTVEYGESFEILTDDETIFVVVSGSAIEAREGTNVYTIPASTVVVLFPDTHCNFSHSDNETHLTFIWPFRS